MSTLRREPARDWWRGDYRRRVSRGRLGPRGFTLTEVLVSVAVMATLVSLLLPGLSGARESARAVGCASNLRQLGAGLHAYAGDFRGFAAPAAANFLRNLDRWHGVRERVGEAFAPTFATRAGALAAYLGEDRPSAGAAGGASVGPVSAALMARSCPTFVPVLDALAGAGRGFERSCGGYGYNGAFLGVQRSRRRGTSDTWDLVTDRTGSPLSRFHRPAMTVAFADSAMVDPQHGSGAHGVIEYSFIEPRFWPDAPQPRGDDARPDPSMHFRHGTRAGKAGAANAAFVDGHVTGLPRARTHSSGIYAAPPTDPLTGWSGDADDNSGFGYE